MTILVYISKTITYREILARVKMISKSSSTKVVITSKTQTVPGMSYWPLYLNFADFCCSLPIS